MFKLLIPLALLFILIAPSQGVRCYQCTYIAGVETRDMNPHCLDNVKDNTVHFEDGVACLTAEGEIDGQKFIVRRAFLSGSQAPATFPKGQEALKCDDYRVTSFGGAQVTRVGDKRVDKLSSCSLCNDRDDCNAAGGLGASFALLGMTLLVSLVYWR